MSDAQRLRSRRLSDVDQWELYELSTDAGAKLVIGLRPLNEYRQVEYEIWEDLGAEPSRRGFIACDDTGDRWATVSRSDLLRGVIDDATRKT